MPYYFGEDDEGWDAQMEAAEARYAADKTFLKTPNELFQYVEPWQAKAAVVPFPRNPGPAPVEPGSHVAKPPAPPRPSLFGRLFGSRELAKPVQSAPTIEIGSKEWHENYLKEQQHQSDVALYRIARTAEALRAHGVKRVFANYDGGNDEGFVNFESVEFADGQRLGFEDDRVQVAIAAATRAAYGQAADTSWFADDGTTEVVSDAVVVLLGPGFGTGPYEMRGAVTIDCDTCTIIDEQDRARIFSANDDEA